LILLPVVDRTTAWCLSVVVGSDPVADYMRLAAIPRESVAEVEQLLRRQESGSNTLAVLERPDQTVVLLKIQAGEATLFSFLPSDPGRTLVHETYIGKIYDATITELHAGAPAPKPERVEITGSRLGGVINLTHYRVDERAALMDALREVVAR
jgi:hypothetical protein